MSKLKKLGIRSLGKQFAALSALLGLFCGVLYSFGGFVYDYYFGYLGYGTALAFMALIGMPLLFAAIGFLCGVLIAILFNFAARFTGGIDIELTDD
ncbi:MAG: hypothetical protein HKN88_05225 [Gammaproteobacteria bacterium]|nr:hypothetical protein [Gammaproteobacteria bacterium]NNC97455.1 hypothetical protein [Gammaproteobacteria bacterium]NNM12982.1 hypothetical protein [Gammaproteobacteria bacterium]